MAHKYPQGSTWRKWDLHVHAPGTKLSDGYKASGKDSAVDEFCHAIYNSDVAAVSIADYFCFDSYFAVMERYRQLFPDDPTLILPNLELRLPVSVNKAGQQVNLHLLFPPDLQKTTANKFLSRLSTEGTTGRDRTKLTCSDLSSKSEFESATVSMDAIDAAIRDTFGEHATVPNRRQEYLLVLVSGKGDGIRPGGSGKSRKDLLTDEIDKYCDAIFSNNRSRAHFLDPNRLESDEVVAAKPVFDGCDAHSFDQLSGSLGKHQDIEGNKRSITWIKADPTYAGLLQTLIEPADRVAIQATAPDRKEPYKVISKVRFSRTDTFPSEIVFNPNLNSIIGSRSSGKSSLLAYIAYSVDPDETVKTQMEAEGKENAGAVGPAAGLTWEEVTNISCEVEWGGEEGTSGKVIYIPQNSLYRLSEHPQDITRKIQPALFRAYPELKTSFNRAQSTVTAENKSIRDLVHSWFEKAGQIEHKDDEIRDLGDKKAIAAERDRLYDEIERLQNDSQLSDEEISDFQKVSQSLKEGEIRLTAIDSALQQLSSYVVLPESDEDPTILPQTVSVTIGTAPSEEHLAGSLGTRIVELREQARTTLIDSIEAELLSAVKSLRFDQATINETIRILNEDHKDLLAKHKANENLAEVVDAHKAQEALIDDIAQLETEREGLVASQQKLIDELSEAIVGRERALEMLQTEFSTEPRTLKNLKFGIETGVPDESLENTSRGFNRRKSSDYLLSGSTAVLDFQMAQDTPSKFLHDMYTQHVGLKSGYDPRSVAEEVLTLTREVRFSAVLDEDHIGGFKKPSMTPGKQALFALTLILNESQEPWPLLIDQPEDDLDSRSIYETIVPYLAERKKERQIIMVSHNANLVIGADSEQITVANRHGDDRTNRDERTFDYLTGSLEHSEVNPTAIYELERWGLREHAVEILDGGEDAFQKRLEKYKLPLGD